MAAVSHTLQDPIDGSETCETTFEESWVVLCVLRQRMLGFHESHVLLA